MWLFSRCIWQRVASLSILGACRGSKTASVLQVGWMHWKEVENCYRAVASQYKWFKLQQSPNWDLFTAAGVYWTGLPRCCEIAFGFSHWIEMLGFLFFVSILFPVFSDYRSIYPLSFRSFFVRHCSPVLCRAVASVWSAGSWRRPPPRERGSARCSSIRTNTCWKDRWVQRPGRTCCSSRLRSRQTGSTERRKTESVNDAQTTWPAGMFFIRNPIWCLCAHHCVYQSAVIHLVSGAAQKKLSKIF